MNYEEMLELMESLQTKLNRGGLEAILEPFRPGENPIFGINLEGWDLLLEVTMT